MPWPRPLHLLTCPPNPATLAARFCSLAANHPTNPRKEWGVMNRLALPIAGLLLVLAGCNQSSEPTASNQASHTGQASAGGAPDQAVYDFLEAVRTGNDQKAAEMLSPLARQKTAEKQMVVAPPGSPTAKFTVGKVKYKPD